MHRQTVRLLPFVLATSLLGACFGGGSAKPADSGASAATQIVAPPDAAVGTKLATVNGLPVGSLAFDALAQRETPANGTAFSLEEKKKLLDEAVVDELLFQEAMRRGAYHDPKVKKILVNLLLREEVYDRVHNEDFADAQLQAFFDQHKEEFVVPEKVQVKRLFFQISPERDQAAAEKLAAEMITKLKADPEQFTQIAIEHSNDPFARRGGDLGYMDREGKPGVPMDVVNKAFTMEAGSISEPFLAAGGINVVLVPARRERIERTFDQMRGSVLRRMKNDKFEELSKQFVEKLRSAAKIEVDDNAVSGYNPAPPARPSMPLPTPDGGAINVPNGPGDLPPGEPPAEDANPEAEAVNAMREAEKAQK